MSLELEKGLRDERKAPSQVKTKLIYKKIQ
jgi:hypothetical protein